MRLLRQEKAAKWKFNIKMSAINFYIRKSVNVDVRCGNATGALASVAESESPLLQEYLFQGRLFQGRLFQGHSFQRHPFQGVPISECLFQENCSQGGSASGKLFPRRSASGGICFVDS